MTYFALTLWVWQQTESATAIALILVFYQLPQIATALFSGILVDRFSRKHLLMLSDTASACCTISVGILAALQMLQLWHIYLIAAIIGCFGNIQALTYATLIPLLVPKQHHTRASSMGTMLGYASGILAPAFAGVLYPLIGLLGITAIDMGSFAIAALTLLWLPITFTASEQDNQEPEQDSSSSTWQNMTFGFRYIASKPSLWMVVVAMSAFAFLNQMTETLYQPLVLARTGGDSQVLGIVVAASGLGGVVGAIALTLWQGFRRRITGIFVGFLGTGISHLLLGVARGTGMWAIARFGASFHSPLIFSSYMAIWYAKVAPALQGRVLAADYVIGIVIEASAGLSAGLLADRVFEPWMRSEHDGVVFLRPIVGIGSGSGMSLLYIICAAGMVLIASLSYQIRPLRLMEDLLPDHGLDPLQSVDVPDF